MVPIREITQTINSKKIMEMKSILRKQLTLWTLVVLVLSGCHNGDEPADQEKTLDHLIFEEICYSGTIKKRVYESEIYTYPYKHDYYIKITNPTKDILYLDGMGLAMSALNAANLVTLKDGTDIRETHFGAGILMRFPGRPGEKNHPVQPGGSVFLAEVAVNHTQKPDEDSDYWTWNEDSYDLSKVDFEWATPKEIEEDDEFPDNPNVPNLILAFPRTRAIKSMISEGSAIALINIPAELTDDILFDPSDKNPYKWNTSWTSHDTGDGHGHGGKMIEYLKFPNEMVIDAVQLCSQKDYKWSVVTGVDAGYASIYDFESAEFVVRSLYRKHDGVKFVDDDNSTTDFEVRPASLAIKAE